MRNSTRNLARIALLAFAAWLPALPTHAWNAQAPPEAAGEESVREAFHRVQTATQMSAQYDYLMTGHVRFILFWVGRDDVGGGYIRRGASPGAPPSESIQLLFGSDPAKAPRKINRWGAATEVVERNPAGDSVVASSFFGFMKSSKGDSAAEMEKEIAKETATSAHRFEAVVGRVDAASGVSKTVPFYADRDFDFHELAAAEQMVLAHLGRPGRIKVADAALRASCARSGNFLWSVAELAESAVRNPTPKPAICYIHHGELYSLRLKAAEPVKEHKARVSLRGKDTPYERTYRNLLRTEFEVRNLTKKTTTEFEMLLGRDGAYRCVPVRIQWQPNWWFRVTLNLNTETSRLPAPSSKPS